MLKTLCAYMLILFFFFGGGLVFADSLVTVGGVGSYPLQTEEIQSVSSKSQSLEKLVRLDSLSINSALDFESVETTKKHKTDNHWENVATRWNLLRKVRVDRQTKIQIAPKKLGKAAGVGFKISWR